MPISVRSDERAATLDRWIHRALLGYCFFLPFVKLVYLPVVYAKIQATELLFLGLVPLFLARYRFSWWPRDRWLAWGLSAYGLVNLLSAVGAGSRDALLESAGRLYLVLMALFFARYVADSALPAVGQQLRVFVQGTLLLGAIALLGYAALWLGYPNRMVVAYADYPYLGTVQRLRGFTGGSGMLTIILLLPVLYFWRRWRVSGRGLTYVLFLFLLAVLTWSKEEVLLVPGCLLVDPGRQQLSRWLVGAVVLGSFLIYVLGTSYIFQFHQSIEESALKGTFYTSERVVWSTEDFQLLETSYTALKRTGWLIARQYPWLGVGPGEFPRYLPAEIDQGNYPAHLPLYEPHSTWIGAAAETGFFGLAALIALSGMLYARYQKLPNQVRLSDEFRPVAIFLLLLLIVSISKDVANFRFLWWGIGILIGLYLRPSDSDSLPSQTRRIDLPS